MKNYSPPKDSGNAGDFQATYFLNGWCTLHKGAFWQGFVHFKIEMNFDNLNSIPTRWGRNQPLYERHMTTSVRNRVKTQTMIKIIKSDFLSWTFYQITKLHLFPTFTQFASLQNVCYLNFTSVEKTSRWNFFNLLKYRESPLTCFSGLGKNPCYM